MSPIGKSTRNPWWCRERCFSSHDSQSILSGNLKHAGCHFGNVCGWLCEHETVVGWAEASLSILGEPPVQEHLWFLPEGPFLSTVHGFEVVRQESFYLPNKKIQGLYMIDLRI